MGSSCIVETVMGNTLSQWNSSLWMECHVMIFAMVIFVQWNTSLGMEIVMIPPMISSVSLEHLFGKLQLFVNGQCD